jgi:hypothetical protein
MSYKFQVGNALVSGSLTHDAGDLTVRTHAGTEAVKMTTAGALSGSGDITMNGSITMGTTISAGGNITAVGSFIIGSADMNEADLEKLDGITAGTAAASKAVVLDASKNIATIGTVGCGAITSTGASSFGAGTFSGVLKTDDSTDATSTTDGSLQTDGGLSVAKDAILGNDVKLLSDSAVLSLGAGSDATFTHDGTTGVVIAANPITLDSEADIVLDANGADVILKDDGTEFGRLSNSSSDMVVASSISNQDLLFKGNDGGSIITALTLDMSEAGAATFNGPITCATSLTIGSAAMSEADLEKLDGITNGTVAANKAVVVDGNLDAASFRNLTATGAVTAASFVIGSADISEAELEQIDGITAGTVAASKAVVVDSNKDANGFRHVSGSGVATFTSFTGSLGGQFLARGPLQLDGAGDAALDVANDSFYYRDASDGLMKRDTMADYATAIAGSGLGVSSGVLSVDIDELSALGGTGLHQTNDHFMFSDGGTEKKITFSNLQDAVFADVSGDATIAAGGALTIAAQAVENSMLADDAVGADELAANAVVEASIVDNAVTLAKMAGITRGSIILGDSSGDPSLLAKGSAAQFLQSDGTDPSYVSISGDATVAAGGALTIANDAVESGMLNDNVISGQSELAADGLAAADEMMISDGGTLKKIGVDTLFLDGPGLLAAAAVDVSADHFMFLDGGATGDAKIESVADLVSGMAGAGLAASGGQLSVQGNAITAWTDSTAFVEGYNYMTGTAGGTAQLPGSPSVGDVVTVKASALASTKKIVITTGGSHTIDGADSIEIESPYGAVSMVYVVANDWRIV